ncbi:MAG: hypothetical protein QM820_11695 [Minicystis sp.]
MTADDLAAVRFFTEADRGTPRGVAITAAIARSAPGCAVTTEPLSAVKGEPLPVTDTRWDLVLSCVPGEDLLVLQAVARFAEMAKVASVGAHLEGLEAVIGPGVVPGETACWNCCRLRRLAHSDRPE